MPVRLRRRVRAGERNVASRETEGASRIQAAAFGSPNTRSNAQLNAKL
jgi:hypothetical protein